MRKEILNYREKPSPDTPMGRKYHSGGHICRPPAPHVHDTSTLTPFRIVKADKVREKHGDTTEALEITLKIDDRGRKHAIAAQMQPGLVFAFEPKNDSATVDAVMECLAPSPQEHFDGVVMPVYSAYMMRTHQQFVPKRDALAGLVDLSRPTVQLVELLVAKAESAGRRLPMGYDATEISKCYSVPELLRYEKFKGLLTLEELCANQPPMHTRPYTISDFDRDKGTVSILISGVSARLAEGDPLGIKPSRKKGQVKDSGLATDMMMDIATGGKGGSPDGEYPLNGYLVTDGPKLVFPFGLSEATPALEHAMTVDHGYPLRTKWFHDLRPIVEEKAPTDETETTLYFLATGSGMAPYMALLRDLSRKRQADPDNFRMPCRIVLINGGRYEEDELFPTECRRFVEEGLVEAYHAVSSATGVEKVVTRKDGRLHEENVVRERKDGGRLYVQDVLEEAYGRDMEQQLRDGKARLYICGTQGVLSGVMLKWRDALCDVPEAYRTEGRDAPQDITEFLEKKENMAAFLEEPHDFIRDHTVIQHTASVPTRFFRYWEKDHEMTDEHGEIRYNLPKPVMQRPRDGSGDWRERVQRAATPRHQSTTAAAGR